MTTVQPAATAEASFKQMNSEFPPTRIVQVEARKRRTPIVQNAHQAARRDVIGGLIFKDRSKTQTSERPRKRQVGVVRCEVAIDPDRQRPAPPFELPGVETAATAFAIVDAKVGR